MCLKPRQQNVILRTGTSTVREKQQLWSSDGTVTTWQPLPGPTSESVSFARYRKKSPSELRRDAHRAMTRQQQLLAQGQSVKPSKDISSTQVIDTNFALFENPTTQPSPSSPIDDDS